MTKVNDFILKNIIKHLTNLGLDAPNARWCADKGVQYYLTNIGNSKNAFNEACDYAGKMAEQRSLNFKYSSPKTKSRPRIKKPQDIFNFEE